mmetsp:Transcript_147948/g.283514  ORF Transcript_147948/g.283514 Transcript_147948/m.283514 type:complete len:247 (+) Transcript_147948:482-1222(+)
MAYSRILDYRHGHLPIHRLLPRGEVDLEPPENHHELLEGMALDRFGCRRSRLDNEAHGQHSPSGRTWANSSSPARDAYPSPSPHHETEEGRKYGVQLDRQRVHVHRLRVGQTADLNPDLEPHGCVRLVFRWQGIQRCRGSEELVAGYWRDASFRRRVGMAIFDFLALVNHPIHASVNGYLCNQHPGADLLNRHSVLGTRGTLFHHWKCECIDDCSPEHVKRRDEAVLAVTQVSEAEKHQEGPLRTY